MFPTSSCTHRGCLRLLLLIDISTCIASKLLEHILVSNIMSHFDANTLLSQYHHGFRSKHSCESQLISFTQEVNHNLENGNQTYIIVMDFSKALDTVDHNKLIQIICTRVSSSGNTMDQLFLTMSHPKSTNRWMHVGHFTRNIWGPPRVSIGSMPFPSIYK